MSGTSMADMSGVSQTSSLQASLSSIPTGHTVIARFFVSPLHFEVPFDVNVTIDADISPGNNEGYSKLSQMASADERTLTIDGMLTGSASLGGGGGFYEVKPEADDCAHGGGTMHLPGPPEREMFETPLTAGGVITTSNT